MLVAIMVSRQGWVRVEGWFHGDEDIVVEEYIKAQE